MLIFIYSYFYGDNMLSRNDIFQDEEFCGKMLIIGIILGIWLFNISCLIFIINAII